MSSEPTPAAVTTGGRAPGLAFGPFVFDPQRRLLRRDDVEVPLPPRVLSVLELLLGRAGEVVSRQELIDSVWKEAFVTDTSLAEAVSYLRQALGDDSQMPTYVQTVHRRGYRFVAPISEAASGAARTAPEPGAAAVARDGDTAPPPLRPSIGNELVPWIVAILSFATALSAIWYATGQEPIRHPIVKIPIDLAPGSEFDDRAPAIALSRSGARVAWSACTAGTCRLYLRDLEGLHERAIPQTEGAAAPFFSPDELWLGFFADGKLKKVFLQGGSPMTIADASQPYGATWAADGRIVFAASMADGLLRVADQGGEVETLTRPAADAGEIRHVFPSAMPDNGGILFTVVTSPVEGTPGRLALLPYAAGRPASSWRVLVEGAHVGRAVGREYLAFARGGDVHAVPFDAVRQTAAGPEHVVEGRVNSPHLAVSENGALVISVLSDIEPSVSAPAWSWNTAPTEAISSIPTHRQPRLSPDGLRVAAVDGESRPDVWVVDVERGTSTRVTYTAPNGSPVWSADGTSVFYASRGTGGFEIRSRPITGGEERKVLARAGRHVFPGSASGAGHLAFTESGGETRSDIGLMRAADPGSASLVVSTPFDETAPALSPDAGLLAYQSDESGRWQVAVLRLSDGRRTTVSRDGGTRPLWSRDGRTLYFHAEDSLMAAAATAEGDLGPPTLVSRLNGAEAVGVRPDGALLLFRRHNGDVRANYGILTLQWIEHLRRVIAPPIPPTPR